MKIETIKELQAWLLHDSKPMRAVATKAESKGWVLLMTARGRNNSLISFCQNKDNEWCSHLVLSDDEENPYFEQGDYISKDGQQAFNEFKKRLIEG